MGEFIAGAIVMFFVLHWIEQSRLDREAKRLPKRPPMTDEEWKAAQDHNPETANKPYISSDPNDGTIR